MKKKTYAALVVGCGNIGWLYDDANPHWISTHIGGYQKHTRTVVTGVVDRDLNQAKNCSAKLNIPHYGTNLGAMLKKLNPDIVSLCTPLETHAALYAEIAKHPSVKAVFYEKPFTHTIPSAKKVLAIEKKAGPAIFVNHLRRYDKLHHALKESLPALIGQPTSFSAYYSGGLVNTGSHLIDLLRFYFGNLVSCQAVHTGATRRDAVTANLQFKKNMQGTIIALESRSYPIFEISFFGPKGRLDYINKPFVDYELRYVPAEKDRIMKQVFVLGKKEMQVFKKHFPRDYFLRAIDEIVQYLDGEITRADITSSGKDGYAATEAIAACLYSAKQGGKKINFPCTAPITLRMEKGEFSQWKKN